MEDENDTSSMSWEEQTAKEEKNNKKIRGPESSHFRCILLHFRRLECPESSWKHSFATMSTITAPYRLCTKWMSYLCRIFISIFLLTPRSGGDIVSSRSTSSPSPCTASHEFSKIVFRLLISSNYHNYHHTATAIIIACIKNEFSSKSRSSSCNSAIIVVGKWNATSIAAGRRTSGWRSNCTVTQRSKSVHSCRIGSSRSFFFASRKKTTRLEVGSN